MKRKSIAEHMRDVMIECGDEGVWDGDPDPVHEAYGRSGGRVSHPLNRIAAVINAVRRSPLFEQDGCIRACDSSGRREILHPYFKLVNPAEEEA